MSEGSSHEVYIKTEPSDIKAGSTRNINQDIQQTLGHPAEKEILYIFVSIKIRMHDILTEGLP